MKTERFFVSVFMLNLLLFVILVYCFKNETIISALDNIFHAKKVTPGYLMFTPDTLKKYDFRSDTDNIRSDEMNKIFSQTKIKHEDLDRISNIPPYDRAMLITRMFSSMGDGVCLDGMTLPQKIRETAHRHGCSKDYAEIFSVLATYTGLKTRMVHNNLSYGVEVFDGRKWFYIDPYFAITVADEDGNPLSYTQLAWKMIHSGWMRFEFFGGKNHFMDGKKITDNSYYSEPSAYSTIYALMGDNIISIVNKESTIPTEPRFVYTFAPYRDIKPNWVYTNLANDSTAQFKRTLAIGVVLWVILFLVSDVVMPVYFVWSKIRRYKKTNR